jgi:outer membrane protein assembly factor BamB
MRLLRFVVCATLLGCGHAEREFATSADAGPKELLPPDLRTRTTGDDWPAFLGPTGDSVSREKGILKAWPKGGPRVVWQQPLGIGYSMPTISRGRLFVFDRIRNRCRLRCWNAETGASIWAFEYDTTYRDQYGYNGGPRCSPVVDGNRVYAFGPEGMLHCVRATDGKLVWKLDTKKEFGVIQNFFGVGSTPVVEGNLLLVQIGGSPAGSERIPVDELKGNGSGLVAFDKYTGKVKWKVSDELASYSSPTVRTIDKRRLALLFARGGLIGVDVATGKQDFRYPWRSSLLESVNASNPLVVGNQVLISECYEVGTSLLRLKPGGFDKVWTDEDTTARRRRLQTHWMTPIHVDGYVYGSSGRNKGEAELRCLELATGKVVWREPNLTRSSLLLVDGHFICLSEDGTLRLLRVNPKKYDEVVSIQLRMPTKNGKHDPEGVELLDEPCWAAPILSHGLLYVRGEKRLVCLELIPAKK